MAIPGAGALDTSDLVRDEQKVSEIAGNFSGALTDGDRFGNGTAWLGDLDTDGVDDLAVGAPADDTGGTDRGAVWILFMNANGTVKSEQKIADGTGNFSGALSDGDRFGASLARIGDLDDDGVQDLAVGAPLDDGSGTDRGAVWILFMNANGTVASEEKVQPSGTLLDFVLSNDDRFGSSVAGIADLDTDGVEDLAVGVPGEDTGGTDRGAVLIIFMNADGTVKSDQQIADGTGGLGGVLSDGDRFGTGVTGIADLDGDSVEDLAVGAPGNDTGGTDRGAALVLFMNTDGTIKSEQEIAHGIGGLGTVLSDADALGQSLAAVDDIDADGVQELAVGAPGTDDGGTDRGAVWWLFMNADGTVREAQNVSDTAGGFGGTLADGDRFGEAVGNVTDLDGDGEPDLAVGAPRTDDGGADRGAVWVLFATDVDNAAPSVDFSFSPSAPSTADTVDFTDLSSDSDGSVVSWSWEFGDGNTSTDQHPSHSYADDGTYTVNLTVTDDDGDSNTTSQTITVSNVAPSVDFSFSPSDPSTADEIDFTDNSSDSDGSVASWSWEFGDGATSTEQHPNHSYADDGTYTVNLTVTDDDGDTNTTSQTITVGNVGPSVDFGFSPTSPSTADTVDFTDNSSDSDGSIASWSWEFGDGNASTDQHPSHSYGDDGTYTVNLTVTDDDGATNTTSRTITVSNVAPSVDFTFSPSSPSTADTIDFTDQSADTDGSIASWSWEFGDGNTSTDQHPNHSYADDGTYTVNLTVTDDDGATNTTSRTITVSTETDDGGGDDDGGSDTPSEPDPHVLEVDVSPRTLRVGDDVTVRALVENRGGSGSVSITFDLGTGTSYVRSVHLDSGAQANVSLTETIDREGTYQVQVEDVSGGSFEVLASSDDGGGDGTDGPEIRVSSVEIAPDRKLRVGDTVTVTILWTNDGNATGERSYALALDGETVAEGSFAVGPGETVSRNHTVDLPEAGTFELTVDGETVGTLSVEGTDGDATVPGVGAVAATIVLGVVAAVRARRR